MQLKVSLASHNLHSFLISGQHFVFISVSTCSAFNDCVYIHNSVQKSIFCVAYCIYISHHSLNSEAMGQPVNEDFLLCYPVSPVP